MGSDSDWRVMSDASQVAHRLRDRARGRGRLGPPHARQAAALRPRGARPRPPGDHRRRRRRGAPAGHARLGHRPPRHRGAGAARDPRRPRLAAQHRADARRHPGRDRLDQRREERRPARRADPRRRRTTRSPTASRRTPATSRGRSRRRTGGSRSRCERREPAAAAAARARSAASVVEERPLRYPDAASRAVMTRRGWWLVILNFLLPGSAQVARRQPPARPHRPRRDARDVGARRSSACCARCCGRRRLSFVTGAWIPNWLGLLRPCRC